MHAHHFFIRSFVVLLVLQALAGSVAWGAAPTQAADLTRAVEQAVVDYRGSQPSTDILVANVQQEKDWAFGTVAITAPPREGANPIAFLFLARNLVSGWEVVLEPEPQFQDWLQQVPRSLISMEVRAILSNSPGLAGDGSGLLSLPWATGETWTLTGGPHGNTLEALDFAGGSGNIRAARDGVAYTPCANQVVIYHEGGWRTGYYHVAGVAVGNGQAVSRGQYLGRTSTEVGCGGSATGPHVHFWLQLNNVLQPAHGKDIGGWTVENGAQPYQGCMVRVRDGVKRCSGSGQIDNDGTIGSGTPPDTTPPTGTITSPADNSATNNPIFTITADASDNAGGSGVNRVEFFAYHDGTWERICTGTSPPYACPWDATRLTDQALLFTMHVYDHAGNQAVDPGGYRHVILDRTPPPIPIVTDSAGSTNGIWQNRLCQPNFVWDAVTDNLTGVAGYLIYWGTDPHGTSETLITETEFTPPACAGPVAISSLRMATRDTVGNTSAWHTVYTLRYDKSEPSGQFTLNHSWTAARSRAVPLDLTPEDTGSGVGAMRVGDTCTSLGDWQPFQPRLWWQLAGTHGSVAQVCVQYHDRAGNESTPIERQLQLDFYPQRPASARYRVTADVVAMQGSVRTTDHYQVQSTMGQVLASGSYARSPTYQLALGYWAGLGPGPTSTSMTPTPTVTATDGVTATPTRTGTPTPTRTGTPTPTAIPGPGGDLYLPLVWR